MPLVHSERLASALIAEICEIIDSSLSLLLQLKFQCKVLHMLFLCNEGE